MSAEVLPGQALVALARQLRDEGTVISDLVSDPAERPELGLLAAAGPRAADDRAGYAVVIESVREGYLLHYGEPRMVLGADSGLRLLAGDYLYALGLDRLAAISDQEAIRELADLISLSAQLHAGESPDAEVAHWLWLGAATAIAAGPSEAFDAAKQAVRAGHGDALEAIRSASREVAAREGLAEALGEVSEAIHFPG